MPARPPVTGAGAASEHRNPKLAPIPLAAGGGVAPPAGAPVEVAQPLQPDAGSVMVRDEHGNQQILSPRALAAANEQALQPLNFAGGVASDAGPVVAASTRVVQAAGPAPAKVLRQLPVAVAQPLAQPPDAGAAAAPPLQRAPSRFGKGTAATRDANRAAADLKDQQRAARAAPPVVAASEVALPQPPVDAVGAHLAKEPKPVIAAGGAGAMVMDALKSRPVQASRGGDPGRPAASNSDSPSRGIPRAIDDPGKKITGGFGDGIDAQYFPLDGSEVLKVVWVVMDQLALRLQNDLRFSMAVVYPRVEITAAITVKGYAADQTFTIQKIAPPEHRTPEEIAILNGDAVVFVVSEERREFDRDGSISSPANAMRAEIGVVAPKKQFVGSGASRQLVDIPPQEDPS